MDSELSIKHARRPWHSVSDLSRFKEVFAEQFLDSSLGKIDNSNLKIFGSIAFLENMSQR